ncbi:YidH family protein [Demequina zhanjiangensis]|uniref:DUF202 domain-containing protein n=1 Tax=Demequina zhanjiangensis TaxID=3051659 RepID=A0ABT8G0C7_9MICO|nr:DUF202 domain-containing protein [Demequina sp. SYSU T00b26]MDN4472596.1 DUF202 domain-containing protein [Demequina sp. SYSU T00b26]
MPKDSGAAPQRFPRHVYRAGDEPDARFSMANERTFLAWIRTALALIAAGLALEAFEVPIAPGLRAGAALGLLLLGILAALQAWVGWVRTERAMREGRPLEPPRLAVVLVIGLIAAAVAVAVGLAL